MAANNRRATDVSAAVKESRARIDEENDPQRKLWRSLDFYATPPWAARAGCELIRELDCGARGIWDPACGMGHISEPARDYWAYVWSTDIHDYGVGYPCADFLDDAAGNFTADWIVTNPPFAYGQRFVELALERARRGVAMLCRLAFIESADRYPIMSRLTLLAPFAERVPMQLGPWNPKLGTATAYAWFIWSKAHGATRMPPHIIAPGTRDRLWKPDDVERFGLKEETPLLDWGFPAGVS